MRKIIQLRFFIITTIFTVSSSCNKGNSGQLILSESIVLKEHTSPRSRNYYKTGIYNKCLNCPDSAYKKYTPEKTFDDYPCELYTGKKEKINYKSHSIAREYKTMITNGYSQSDINFGGNYVLVTWGCGAPCSSGAIVDTRNGDVYPVPTTGFGYSFRKNSTLLIGDPPDERGYNYIFEEYSVDVLEYIWDEKTKSFIEIELEKI